MVTKSRQDTSEMHELFVTYLESCRLMVAIRDTREALHREIVSVAGLLGQSYSAQISRKTRSPGTAAKGR